MGLKPMTSKIMDSTVRVPGMLTLTTDPLGTSVIIMVCGMK